MSPTSTRAASVHLARVAALLLLGACGAAPGDASDAAPSDAGRPCALPIQLQIDFAERGDCAGLPIVGLVMDGAGAVESVSARVPVGVTVPSIACAGAAPTVAAGACSWALSLHCEGGNGERVDLDGTLTGAGTTWTSSSLTATLTGLPPPRLTCTATSSATTR